MVSLAQDLRHLSGNVPFRERHSTSKFIFLGKNSGKLRCRVHLVPEIEYQLFDPAVTFRMGVTPSLGWHAINSTNDW